MPLISEVLMISIPPLSGFRALSDLLLLIQLILPYCGLCHEQRPRSCPRLADENDGDLKALARRCNNSE